MKYLLIILLSFSMLSCAGLSDPREMLSKLPDGGFDKLIWNRNTGPSSATLTAEGAMVVDGGIIIDKVELTENFAFGSFYLYIEKYWIEGKQNGRDIKEDQ